MLSSMSALKPATRPVAAPRRAVRVSAAASPEGVVSRRGAALSLAAAAAALLVKPSASQAAYGEAANVFGGEPTNDSGFVPYSGDGFALLLPASWGPGKERAYPGSVLRMEDNYFVANQLEVVVTPSEGKSKIEDYGTPEAFMTTNMQGMLGKQAWQGDTMSEGGFAKGKVSVANVLSVGSRKDSNGKTYYCAEILTRTADGNEGGHHHLFEAAVSNGKLYMLKQQLGDKRWIRMMDSAAKTVSNSFTVV